MGALEVLEQLVVRSGLFQRVQLSPVEVLQQRVEQQLLVVRGADDGGNPLQARFTAGPPPTLTHDELVAVRAHLPDDDRLEKADFLDGDDQLGQRVLVEYLTGLARVRGDRPDRQLGEVRTGRPGILLGPALRRGRRLRHHRDGRQRGHLRSGHPALRCQNRTSAGRRRTASGRRHLLLLRSGGDQRTEPTSQSSTTLTH
ncbi:hypothetical protein QF048_003784 [Streptomyces sp. W4I9-2]|nr:hypothetical protein [Streptomyces sp. W4I9-2]